MEILRLLWHPLLRSQEEGGDPIRPIPSPTLGRICLPGGTPRAEKHPRVQHGFPEKTQKQTGLSEEALPACEHGAFIWIVRVSAKPTKCLQPAPPAVHAIKRGTGVWLTSLQGVLPSPVGSLSFPFSVYIHTLALQTHAFITFHYITWCLAAADGEKGFITSQALSVAGHPTADGKVGSCRYR